MITTTSWRLLGFDARIEGHEPLPLSMRETFLLRPEVERPYSVDTNIWPSRFRYFSLSPTTPDSGELTPDADCDGGLWLDLARMNLRLSEQGTNAVRIAVELLAPHDLDVDQFPSPLIYRTAVPPAPPPGAIVLGFDVADSGFLSGLTNCGYSEEERRSLRPDWAPRINQFGLLSVLEDALAFQAISNQRVPEHAPFWIYRLSQIF